MNNANGEKLYAQLHIVLLIRKISKQKRMQFLKVKLFTQRDENLIKTRQSQNTGIQNELNTTLLTPETPRSPCSFLSADTQQHPSHHNMASLFLKLPLIDQDCCQPDHLHQLRQSQQTEGNNRVFRLCPACELNWRLSVDCPMV